MKDRRGAGTTQLGRAEKPFRRSGIVLSHPNPFAGARAQTRRWRDKAQDLRESCGVARRDSHRGAAIQIMSALILFGYLGNRCANCAHRILLIFIWESELCGPPSLRFIPSRTISSP